MKNTDPKFNDIEQHKPSSKDDIQLDGNLGLFFSAMCLQVSKKEHGFTIRETLEHYLSVEVSAEELKDIGKQLIELAEHK